MDNYYKRPSPQEQRYRDVLDAIRSLGVAGADLADELDDAVTQMVRRAVDVAVADHDGQRVSSFSSSFSRQRRPPTTGDAIEELRHIEASLDMDRNMPAGRP
jgi:hypothetical protein